MLYTSLCGLHAHRDPQRRHTAGILLILLHGSTSCTTGEKLQFAGTNIDE